MNPKIIFIFVFTIFSMMASAAHGQLLSWSFFKSNYDNSYKDDGQAIGSQFMLVGVPEHHFSLGYTFTERTYGDGAKFRKNNFLISDTWAPSHNSYYVDFFAEYAGSTPIGATSVLGINPHVTYFKNWDLGIGLQNASYQTGSVFVVNPQVLYLTGPWTLGVSTWIFNDKGSHSTFREFARYTTPAKLKTEVSLASGETREDVGVVDHFTSYSLNVSKFWNNFGLGGMAERYEGGLRKGYSLQVEFQWQW